MPQVNHDGDLARVLADGETFLGPGLVCAMDGGTPLVELPGGRRVRPRLALAFPYVPVLEDELLIIGRQDAFFVIGVLRAGAELTLQFPGDVQIRSESDLRLEADEGIELTAGEIDVKTKTMRVVADTVVATARELYQRVQDAFCVQAGSKQEQVTGEWSARAENAHITTAADISVNGREIRLG